MRKYQLMQSLVSPKLCVEALILDSRMDIALGVFFHAKFAPHRKGAKVDMDSFHWYLSQSFTAFSES